MIGQARIEAERTFLYPSKTKHYFLDTEMPASTVTMAPET